MKKILKYSLLAALGLLMAATTGCKKSELDTDQFNGFSLAAIAPNPVMRGAELHIVGGGLENAAEVRFAGGVTVTDIKVVVTGAQSEICVTVPMEGPEVGKVTVVAKDGRTASTRFDLTYTEPIVIDSFSPEEVLSGDVITIKGEYLNDVKEIIFTGNEAAVTTEFVSQSRYELKVKVPASAISGPIIFSDVNELEDESSIPNHIYTKTDLVVGKPTVVKAEKATYKSGDLITVTGAHLDMIQNVALPQVEEVSFDLAEDGTSILFNLPPEATDGSIILTSFAGDTFDAGEIETVTVRDLTVKSLAEDERYKAGSEVEITGTDLDLVTELAFNKAGDTSWYLDGNKIIAVVPADAQDGPVTVTLDSGKQAYSEDIEVVKPEIQDWEIFDEYVAGETVVTVRGEDLDLVTDVTIGDKEQGLIPCEYELVTDEFGYTDVKVKLPAQAYTGPITFTSAAGYQTSTNEIVVTYDMAVSIEFATPSFGLGNQIILKGKNLLQIEQVYIKGKKVTGYSIRSDEAMSFAIPDKVGPGVYRLELILVDGTELTWPVPFEITAPFTETYIWQGKHDLAGWGANLEAGPEDGFVQAGLQVGDLVRIYYETYNEWWQYKLQAGHWDAINLDVLGGENTVSANNAASGDTFFSFEVTDAIYAQLTKTGEGWGYSFVINGEGAYIKGISMIHFGAAEKRTTIWEGSSTVTWDGGAVTALSWGGYDWTTVEPGTKLSMVYTIDNPDGCIRVGNGSWASIPSLAPLAEDGNLPLTEGGLTVELTEEDVNFLINNGGLVICGTGYTITEIALVTIEGGGATEKTIWEGESTVTWNGGAVSALAYGGFDWSTVEAGTILCAHYTIDDPSGCIRFGAGNWASIPSLAPLAEDGNLPLKEGGHEVELTQEDIDYLIAGDGMVVCGTGYTITSIGLK